MLCLSGAGASAQEYVDYLNKQFGFAFEVPKQWPPPVKKSVATLIFSGPQGSEQYHTTINVQLVKKPGESLQNQVEGVKKQWATATGFKLLSQQPGSLSGYRGVRLLAQYQLPGTNQKFKQEQFIVDRSPYFFWLAYTAPLELFPKYQSIMSQAVGSLRFIPLEAGAAPARPSQPPASSPAPEARIYDLKPCKGVDKGGKPIGITQVFPPNVGRIHVWFRFRDLPVGTEIRSEWFFGRPGQMQKATQAGTKVQSPSIDWGQFNLGMKEGRLFPVADYRVDVYVGQKKEASVSFQVRGN